MINASTSSCSTDKRKKAAIVSQYNNFCDKWGFGDTHSKVGEGEYRRTDQVASVSNFGDLRMFIIKENLWDLSPFWTECSSLINIWCEHNI